MRSFGRSRPPEPLPQGARGRREHRLRAGHAGRGRRDGQPARDVELAHRLDPAVLRLRHGAAPPGRRLARRALGVQRVALPSPGLALSLLGLSTSTTLYPSSTSLLVSPAPYDAVPTPTTAQLPGSPIASASLS